MKQHYNENACLDVNELRAIRKSRGDEWDIDIPNTIVEVRPILHGSEVNGYVYCCSDDIEDMYSDKELGLR